MKELSQILNISKQTVSSLCKEGWFDVLTLPNGGRKLITVESVDRFINLNTKKGFAYDKKLVRLDMNEGIKMNVVSPSIRLKRRKGINNVKEKEC